MLETWRLETGTLLAATTHDPLGRAHARCRCFEDAELGEEVALRDFALAAGRFVEDVAAVFGGVGGLDGKMDG
jgi:hypothetical protein